MKKWLKTDYKILQYFLSLFRKMLKSFGKSVPLFDNSNKE